MNEIVLVNFKTRGAIYGIGTYIEELAYCFQQLKVNVTIIEASPLHSGFRVEEREGVKKLVFPFSYYLQDDSPYYARIASLLQLHLKDSSDVIFQFNHFLQKGLLDQIKIKFPKAKIIFTIHFFQWSAPLQGNVDLLYRLLTESDKKPSKRYVPIIQGYLLEREIFREVDLVVSLSEDTSSLLLQGYGIEAGKVFHMPNGLRDINPVGENLRNRRRKKFHISRDEIILLFVGRLDPIKGIIPLLTSFRKIADRYDNCRLVLIGDGDYSILQNYSRIMSKVTVLGKINKEEVFKWYSIADIGVFPSLYEECSYVGIEMMMHGLPVVASNSYSVKNMFYHQRNALVAKRDPDHSSQVYSNKLFENLTQLIDSEELRNEIALKSRKAYEEKYDLHVMRENCMRLLECL